MLRICSLFPKHSESLPTLPNCHRWTQYSDWLSVTGRRPKKRRDPPRKDSKTMWQAFWRENLFMADKDAEAIVKCKAAIVQMLVCSHFLSWLIVHTTESLAASSNRNSASETEPSFAFSASQRIQNHAQLHHRIHLSNWLRTRDLRARLPARCLLSAVGGQQPPFQWY